MCEHKSHPMHSTCIYWCGPDSIPGFKKWLAQTSLLWTLTITVIYANVLNVTKKEFSYMYIKTSREELAAKTVPSGQELGDSSHAEWN